MSIEESQLRAQAARVLEHIQSLDQHYGELLSSGSPELSDALAEVVVALDRFLAEPVANSGGSGGRSRGAL